MANSPRETTPETGAERWQFRGELTKADGSYFGSGSLSYRSRPSNRKLKVDMAKHLTSHFGKEAGLKMKIETEIQP